MKHTLHQFFIAFLLVATIFKSTTVSAQNELATAGAIAGAVAITFLAADASVKETAKEISQFRSKEFIMDAIIGDAGNKEIRFETESLASDDSAGVVSIAFNCSELDKKGLLLAFIGQVKNEFGVLSTAYGFKFIPYDEAVDLLNRIDQVKDDNKDYMKDENDVNNVYIQHKDMRFIIYRDNGEKIRVFWNGFEVEWERTPFDRTKRRLQKWFK